MAIQTKSSPGNPRGIGSMLLNPCLVLNQVASFSFIESNLWFLSITSFSHTYVHFMLTIYTNDTVSTIAATTFAATLAGPFYSYYPWSFTNNYSIITGKSTATVNFRALPTISSITLTVKTPSIRQWSDFGLIHLKHTVNQNGCNTYKTPCDCNH